MPLFDYPTGPVTLDDVAAFVAGAQAVVGKASNETLRVARQIHPQQTTVKIMLGGEPWAFVDLESGLLYAVGVYGTPARYPRGTIRTAGYGAEHIDANGPLPVERLLP